MTGDGKVRLNLNRVPDGYGFLYGTAITPEGEVFQVNILPPVSHWRGDQKLERYTPHETDWVVYVDGEEVARVRSREDLETELATILPALGCGRDI